MVGIHRLRTNIVIDGRLVREALRATRLKTKREAGELDLLTLVRLNRQAEIRKLRGRFNVAGRPRNNAEGPLVLVDSSVWIDYFRGIRNRPVGTLNSCLSGSRWRSMTLYWPKCYGDFPMKQTSTKCAVCLRL